MKSIKNIYKDFGLRFNVIEARKLLGLDKTVSKKDVNNLLRDLYNQQQEEINKQKIYSYTLSGTYQYITTQPKIKNSKVSFKPTISKPYNIEISFQSKTFYKLTPFNFYTVEEDDKLFKNLWKKNKSNNYPMITNIDDTLEYLNNEEITYKFKSKAKGSNVIITPIKLKYKTYKSNQNPTIKTDEGLTKLKNLPLYKAVIFTQYPQFNGFKDTGSGCCVPETIFHHLTLKGKNKKLKYDDFIGVCENFKGVLPSNSKYNYIYEIDEIEGYEDPEEEEGNVKEGDEYYIDNIANFDDSSDDEEPIIYRNRGEGYTPLEIIKILEHYKIRGKLVNNNLEEFLTTDYTLPVNKNTKTFCGMCYNNHLYYCDDKALVKSITEKSKKDKSCFDKETYDKKNIDNREYDVRVDSDLIDDYIELVKQTNSFKKINSYNGNIVSIEQDNKLIVSNPDKEIMISLLGEDFKNQNLISLGNEEWNKLFEEDQSKFTKETFDLMTKHKAIRQVFNIPIKETQYAYDINKCRSYAFKNNKLGDYEKINVYNDVKNYSGMIEKGLYYIEIKHEFLTNGWYSGDFCKIIKKKNFTFDIKFELTTSQVINKNIGKKFVDEMVKKYPNAYKNIINSRMGCFGKTQSKYKKGFIEPNFELAKAYFWDCNDENIGYNYDLDVDTKRWNKLKGKSCDITHIKIDDDTKHYLVETTEFTTLYNNDLPIYNKIMENEYLLLMEKLDYLKTLGKYRLIKINTDEIVVEWEDDKTHDKVKLSNEMGGLKYRVLELENIQIKETKINNTNINTNIINWNIVEEQSDNTFKIPSSSFLITGLAGFGKSFEMKKLPEYELDTTIKLGFTNVSCKNIDGVSLNSYFKIDFRNEKCSEKQISKLKDVKCIMITEVFMTPSYIMSILLKIKKTFPEIKFICEGDPEQNRPVGEENINWLETTLLYQICDSNMVKLMYNKRNNETENYIKLINGERLDKEKYGQREPQQINICKTNQTRVKINKLVMNKTGEIFNAPKLIKLNFNYHDNKINMNLNIQLVNEKSQDCYLTTETPVMCIKNNKTCDIMNSVIYKIEKIEDGKIIINNNKYDNIEFHRYFVVAYCYTNHKVQGATIKENYNIYDWKMMTSRERYTAYSRTTNGKNVLITE